MDLSEEDLLFKVISESGLTLLADVGAACSKKSVLYYDKDLSLTRLLICSILNEYIASKLSPTSPVKCIDIFGCTGVSGLLWKRMFGNDVEVFINDGNTCTSNFIQKNAKNNGLDVFVLNKDPAIALHEAGRSFIYLDCGSESPYYFDAAFRNISRNGIIIITAKDDPSLQGCNPGIARRRYGGLITRTNYSYELAARLVISSLARSAAKYNKGINVLCCYSIKGSFTIAVSIRKGPTEADTSLDNIKELLHCTKCNERRFRDSSSIYITEGTKALCDCNAKVMILGPVWAGDLFDVDFLSKMVESNIPSEVHLQTLLKTILDEGRCLGGKAGDQSADEVPAEKKARVPSTSPPFYYNLHQLHFSIERLPSVASVVTALRKAGYRASKTHFCKLSVRTNASLVQLQNVISEIKGS